MMSWQAARVWLFERGWVARRTVLQAVFPDGVTESALRAWALANLPPPRPRAAP